MINYCPVCRLVVYVNVRCYVLGKKEIEELTCEHCNTTLNTYEYNIEDKKNG